MKRCFGTGNPLYEQYHDEEWGIPVHNDQHLFEMLILEGAQAGLSWELILKRRHGYREAFHQFNPHGVSGVVIITESHLFIHTWPEHGYAAADIFTCGDSVQPEKAAQILVRKLGAKNHSIVEIQRGILDTQ